MIYFVIPVFAGLLLAVTSPVSLAEVPDIMNYQGYLTTSDGSPADGMLPVTFSLYDSESAVTSLWSDSITITVTQGLFSAELGGGLTALPDGLTDQPLYLGLAVDGDAEMLPRRALTSVAFALKARDAETVVGVEPIALTDPRTPIDSLPLTIDASGSYFLTQSFYAPAGGPAITINADNVTIDLMGFSLIGTGGGTVNQGIELAGRSNVEIRDGTIRDFGAVGITMSGLTGSSNRIIDVAIIGNHRGVLFVGPNHEVRGCTISSNEGYGLQAVSGGTGLVVAGNTVGSNGGVGIDVGNGLVSENVVIKNAGNGIQATSATVFANTVTENSGDGIQVREGHVAGNKVKSNSGIGILESGSGFIVDNDVTRNDTGISVEDKSLVRGNHLYSNTQEAILVEGEGNIIEDNAIQSFGSGTIGINFVGTGNFYAGNRLSVGVDYVNAAGQTDGGDNVSF